MLTLVRDRVAKQFVGPTDAVYCRLEDPQGLTVFDSFGRCYLELDKVGLEHNGIWKILVAGPSTILTREQHLVVNVIESGMCVFCVYILMTFRMSIIIKIIK